MNERYKLMKIVLWYLIALTLIAALCASFSWFLPSYYIRPADENFMQTLIRLDPTANALADFFITPQNFFYYFIPSVGNFLLALRLDDKNEYEGNKVTCKIYVILSFLLIHFLVITFLHGVLYIAGGVRER